VSVLLVFLGGALGAPARYLIDRAVQARSDVVFPFGTLVANLTGAFLLGALIAASRHVGLSREVVLAAGSGFCGALTTFSTFSFETIRLLEDGSLVEAVLNTLTSLVVGILVASAGYALLTLSV